jgi:hypothetical protein
LFLVGAFPDSATVRVELRPDTVQQRGGSSPDDASVWDLSQTFADLSAALSFTYLFLGFDFYRTKIRAADHKGGVQGIFSSITTPVKPVFVEPLVESVVVDAQ